MKTPKQTLDKLNEGCGKREETKIVGGIRVVLCSPQDLCPECKRAKNQFIKDCKNEFEYLRDKKFKSSRNLRNLSSDEVMKERFEQLKEVINSEEAEE